MNKGASIARLGSVLMVAMAAWIGSVEADVKEHTEVIETSEHSFRIDVGGTMDPENLEITIENDGPVPVVNPRITVNGKFNWYTLPDLIAEITEGCVTDEEKVMAICKFVDRETYDWTYPKDRKRMTPVGNFNIYGYHICSDPACQFVGLCRAAGIESRVFEIWHHSVAEARWDGVWHHFDPDIGVWYLKDDNRTIASGAELEANPEWVARTYIPYRWFLTPGDNRKMIYSSHSNNPSQARLADWYASADNNYIASGYDQWIDAEHRMDITLRPSEKITRWWRPVLRKWYDMERTVEPPRYANGRIIFEPDFEKFTYEGIIERRNLRYKVEDGKMPVISVKSFQDRVHDRPSRLTIPMASPYVMLGGYIDSKVYKGGTGGLDEVSLTAALDPVTGAGSNLWSMKSWAYGYREFRAPLDEKLVNQGPIAAYNISLAYYLSATKAEADEPDNPAFIYGGQAAIDDIKISLDLQVNPGSLPALSLGENVIKYSDETGEPHHIKVTYKWREINDQHLPDAPKQARSPKDWSTIRGLAPKLEWTGASDPDGDKIVNYRVQTSYRPDCAWPVSASLDRDVRSGTSFQVPEGWLNPKTTYYWRVRAEDENGNFSPWSEVWEFKTR